jgi:hypothetical protein
VSSPQAKLDDAKVIEMRRMHDQEGAGAHALARLFKVSPMTAWYVIERKHWKHLP